MMLKCTTSKGSTHSDVSCNLVAHPLGRDNSNLIDYTLVGVEIESQASVVLLNDSRGGLLNGLGTYTL